MFALTLRVVDLRLVFPDNNTKQLSMTRYGELFPVIGASKKL